MLIKDVQNKFSMQYTLTNLWYLYLMIVSVLSYMHNLLTMHSNSKVFFIMQFYVQFTAAMVLLSHYPQG